jgi:hypothetical protein
MYCIAVIIFILIIKLDYLLFIVVFHELYSYVIEVIDNCLFHMFFIIDFLLWIIVIFVLQVDNCLIFEFIHVI